MFSFYGSKSKIIKYYPAPKYSVIIEPFAGSARYSLEYWNNDIILIEKDWKIYRVWSYLKTAHAERILSLPDVPNATRLDTITGWNKLTEPEQWLIGFCSNGGSATPKNVSGRHSFNSWNKDKIRIARDLYKIRHWQIFWGSYETIPFSNNKHTWFIDPPYVKAGKWYKEHDIDYSKLGEWCKSRNGQIMVCEQEGADWLPFKQFRDISFTHFKNDEDKKRKTKEVMWYEEN